MYLRVLLIAATNFHVTALAGTNFSDFCYSES